jgi:hypothetical protein
MSLISNEFYGDGSQALVNDDFSWDLTLPNRKHSRGTATSLDDARSQMLTVHNGYILDHWTLGKPYPGRNFVCPLDP